MPSTPEVSLESKWQDYNDSFEEPDTRNLWASDGFWRLVGNGEKKDNSCGAPVGFEICDSEEHDFIGGLEGKSFKGLVDVHVKHKSCFRYDCPICYLSYAVREAHNIEAKLGQLAKWGLAEHIVLSLPDGMFNSVGDLKSFDVLVSKVIKALKKRFVVGGAIIFHGFRYADHLEALEKGVAFGWRWSPHFHILGFIYGRQAFYDAVPKMFLKDGFVVKLKDKRKTVFGTAWYQCNHASVRVDKKHFRVVRWFGVARKEKFDKSKVAELRCKCRICGRELVNADYLGKKFLDRFKSLSESGRDDRRFFGERLENGERVWIRKERVKSKFVSS